MTNEKWGQLRVLLEDGGDTLVLHLRPEWPGTGQVPPKGWEETLEVHGLSTVTVDQALDMVALAIETGIESWARPLDIRDDSLRDIWGLERPRAIALLKSLNLEWGANSEVPPGLVEWAKVREWFDDDIWDILLPHFDSVGAYAPSLSYLVHMRSNFPSEYSAQMLMDYHGIVFLLLGSDYPHAWSGARPDFELVGRETRRDLHRQMVSQACEGLLIGGVTVEDCRGLTFGEVMAWGGSMYASMPSSPNQVKNILDMARAAGEDLVPLWSLVGDGDDDLDERTLDWLDLAPCFGKTKAMGVAAVLDRHGPQVTVTTVLDMVTGLSLDPSGLDSLLGLVTDLDHSIGEGNRGPWFSWFFDANGRWDTVAQFQREHGDLSLALLMPLLWEGSTPSELGLPK